MITFNDLKRLIAPLRRRIFLSLGRAIVKAYNNSGNTQRVQINALAGETITDIERFQEYGFESYPLNDAEAFAAFLNGNRDQGIVLCVHDRRYRPTDLTQGEACIYTDEDATADFRIWLKRNRITEVLADKFNEVLDTSKTLTTPLDTINADLMQYTATTSAFINSPQITLGSSSRAAVKKIVTETFVDLFNNHVHEDVVAGGDDSGVPTTQIGSTHMTDITRAL